MKNDVNTVLSEIHKEAISLLIAVLFKTQAARTSQATIWQIDK